MPNYRRAVDPGGTFFFTLVTENRAPLFAEERWRKLLHASLAASRSRRRYLIDAIVLLPDHLHMLMTLPEDDTDFPTRLASLKANFTRRFIDAGGEEQPVSTSRVAKRRRGIWQRWFWEHHIRDEADFNNHVEYIHFNPVKHGLARCPHEWSFSSFGKHVERGVLSRDWRCVCNGATQSPFDIHWARGCEPPE